MEENKPVESDKTQECLVTILYYTDASLELIDVVLSLQQNQNGRMIIPDSFKAGKSIVAVCEGEVRILNKIGDRV
ncbi:TIGR02922 family protein [Cognaticolwellia mytili]|uniref:TIGR02922 family protein n=1 Tax=Cognaticolwellia mytili TaxID=1888913 RepID=UPI000A16F771|nr:TIGR02922 family protein [Cognaticolwellia mytili]